MMWGRAGFSGPWRRCVSGRSRQERRLRFPAGKGQRPEEALFGEGAGRILLEVEEETVTMVEQLAKEAGVGCYRLGKSGGTDLQITCGSVQERWGVRELRKLFTESLPQALEG